jgi:hypothetical protein
VRRELNARRTLARLGATLCILGCAHANARSGAVERAATATGPAHTIALVNGNWMIGERVVANTRYIVNGALADHASSRADSTIDLGNGFVIPPLGEAHNHNIEASSRMDALIARYLRDGVFYVENPNVLPRSRAAIAGKVNTPTSVDVIFANGGLTGSGGHPLELVRRNITRGIWTEADGEGAFYWTIDDLGDLGRKWPAIVAQRPDFIKVYLLYSEQYRQRASDSAAFGWRGLDPALLPEIVSRAHAASLRVAAHVETAADFRSAVAAGVDQVAHMPGFRGNERVQLPDAAAYALTDDDARAAAGRGVVVVTTLGGAAGIDPAGPDSLTRRALDALNHRNLATLRRAGVKLALGSDSYRDDSKGEAHYLHGLGVFSDAELVRLWAYDTPRAIFPKRAVGGLTAGSEASFLVLACNPFTSFACTDSIRLRVKDGRVLTLPDAPPPPVTR